MKVTCNEGCKHEFDIKEFRTKEVADNIEQVYFICTHCNKEYVAYYQNESIKKIQKRVRELSYQFKAVSSNKQKKEIESKIQKLQQQMKNEMDQLKNKIVSESPK